MLFSAGIYARLSVDGDERKNESMETQIDIAKAYLEQQEDMRLYDCYTDLGRTGMDFERPGFLRLMQDVRLRRINCIIVKDLSRFGRNHIETGNYLERIFPFLGVRFIAVADGLDTWDRESGRGSLSVPLKNLINEMYARDIGMKVRSGKRARREAGSYIGGVPPYGYDIEQQGDRRCLQPEAVTADIVRQIYERFLAGSSLRDIRCFLYEQGIHSPRDYRHSGHVYRQEGELLREWTPATIRAILMNPAYMNGKYTDRNPPVLSQTVFEAAAARLGKKKKKDRGAGKQAGRKDSGQQIDALVESIRKETEEQNREKTDPLSEINRRIEKIRRKEGEWYKAYRMGRLSREDFISRNEEAECSIQQLVKEWQDKEG